MFCRNSRKYGVGLISQFQSSRKSETILTHMSRERIKKMNARKIILAVLVGFLAGLTIPHRWIVKADTTSHIVRRMVPMRDPEPAYGGYGYPTIDVPGNAMGLSCVPNSSDPTYATCYALIK
jgi:hypothetical protein